MGNASDLLIMHVPVWNKERKGSYTETVTIGFRGDGVVDTPLPAITT